MLRACSRRDGINLCYQSRSHFFVNFRFFLHHRSPTIPALAAVAEPRARIPLGGDAGDAFPGAAGLRSFGENLACAKALVLSRGKDGGRTSSTDRLDGKNGRAVAYGGTAKTTGSGAGRRW